MAFDIEKLKAMAGTRSERATERAQFRMENREWLRMSQDIALALHYHLRTKNMTQKQLAEKMEVSPAYIAKLLKGGENLTLETICRLQNVIGENLMITCTPYIHTMFMEKSTMSEFNDNDCVSDTYTEKTATDDRYVISASGWA